MGGGEEYPGPVALLARSDDEGPLQAEPVLAAELFDADLVVLSHRFANRVGGDLLDTHPIEDIETLPLLKGSTSDHSVRWWTQRSSRAIPAGQDCRLEPRQRRMAGTQRSVGCIVLRSRCLCRPSPASWAAATSAGLCGGACRRRCRAGIRCGGLLGRGDGLLFLFRGGGRRGRLLGWRRRGRRVPLRGGG